MRLPGSFTHAKRKQVVHTTCQLLQLVPVMNSLVGSVKKRGISGGQRKRVNIGVELVSAFPPPPPPPSPCLSSLPGDPAYPRCPSLHPLQVAQPSLLYLDEPTSGLDSTAALTVLTGLKHLCQRGLSSIMVIHQPRQSIFALFDQVREAAGSQSQEPCVQAAVASFSSP